MLFRFWGLRTWQHGAFCLPDLQKTKTDSRFRAHYSVWMRVRRRSWRKSTAGARSSGAHFPKHWERRNGQALSEANFWSWPRFQSRDFKPLPKIRWKLASGQRTEHRFAFIRKYWYWQNVFFLAVSEMLYYKQAFASWLRACLASFKIESKAWRLEDHLLI